MYVSFASEYLINVVFPFDDLYDANHAFPSESKSIDKGSDSTPKPKITLLKGSYSEQLPSYCQLNPLSLYQELPTNFRSLLANSHTN